MPLLLQLINVQQLADSFKNTFSLKLGEPHKHAHFSNAGDDDRTLK